MEKTELVAFEQVKQIYDSISISILVIDEKKDAVFGNKYFSNMIQSFEKSFIGKRLGEIFHCVNTEKERCGDSKFCKYCFANKAVLQAMSGNFLSQECTINQIIENKELSLNLRVDSSSIIVNQKIYFVFTITDISENKRKRNLERIFFHDILNLASSIQTGMSMLMDCGNKYDNDFLNELKKAPARLIEEIHYQKDLTAAEHNDLKVNQEWVILNELLSKITAVYFHSNKKKSVKLMTKMQNPEMIVETDQVLLSRVLGNLLKNAFEASKEGDIITLTVNEDEKFYEILVHNPAYIPQEIQAHIFQRSFSTKGSNRGLGTYAIKLITENYLKGKVEFISDENKGTTFSLRFYYNLL